MKRWGMTDIEIPLLMPVHDRVEELQRTLGSLAVSRLPEKCHLFVVDDGSSDAGVSEALQSIDFVRCTVVEHPYNLGLMTIPIWIDKLFRELTTEMVVVINSDMLFKREWLLRLLEMREMLIGKKYRLGMTSVYKFRIGDLERSRNIREVERFDGYSLMSFVMGQGVAVERQAWQRGNLRVMQRGFYREADSDAGPVRFHHWDVSFSHFCIENGYVLARSNRSYTQHIGIRGEHTEPDGTNHQSDDFDIE